MEENKWHAFRFTCSKCGKQMYTSELCYAAHCEDGRKRLEIYIHAICFKCGGESDYETDADIVVSFCEKLDVEDKPKYVM